MSDPLNNTPRISMKTKTTKKKVAAKAKSRPHNINIEYVEQIADESIATIMALRGLVRMLAEQLEVRK